jgi:hypothetical protein
MTLQQHILARLPLVMFGAKAALLWVLANYTWPSDPVRDFRRGHRPPWRPRWLAAVAIRSLALAVVVTWIACWHWSLGIFSFAVACALPLVRSLIAPRHLAEVEIGANLFFLAGAVELASLHAVGLWTPDSAQPESRQLAALCIVAAIVVFSLRGGTFIVRGVLNKGATLPERPRYSSAHAAATSEHRRVDVAEYNRGRIIGNIERLLLLVFVAMRAWEALAFLITAKGLFRSRDLEQADFAEYFLVGTLISSMIAVAAGLGIQLAVKLLW